MASIIKTPAGYRAFIMLKGIRKTKSFKSKHEAAGWVRIEENLIRTRLLQPDRSVYRSEEALLDCGKEPMFAKNQEIVFVTLSAKDLEKLLERASEYGARQAIMCLVTYNFYGRCQAIRDHYNYSCKTHSGGQNSSCRWPNYGCRTDEISKRNTTVIQSWPETFNPYRGRVLASGTTVGYELTKAHN